MNFLIKSDWRILLCIHSRPFQERLISFDVSLSSIKWWLLLLLLTRWIDRYSVRALFQRRSNRANTTRRKLWFKRFRTISNHTTKRLIWATWFLPQEWKKTLLSLLSDKNAWSKSSRALFTRLLGEFLSFTFRPIPRVSSSSLFSSTSFLSKVRKLI